MIETVQSLLGPIELVGAPVGTVITRKEAKIHCRMDLETHDEDVMIDRVVATATQMCENEIAGHRQFLTATYDVPVSDWWCGRLKLPRPPLQQLEAVFYYDTDDDLQTLESDLYEVTRPLKQPGTIELKPNETWPDVQCDREYPIKIRFRCGYGDAAAVPLVAKQAILITTAALMGHRQCVDEETMQGIANLLEMHLGYGSYA